MKKKDLDRIVDIAEELGWDVYFSQSDFTFELQRYSPAGQDHNVCLEAKDLPTFISELGKYVDSFDVSEETYYWLDDYGHGDNGAPYDMKDVYEDMESCKTMTKELLDAIVEKTK